MITTETLHSAPVSTPKCPNQGRINLFVERFSSGKPYLFFDVFGDDPLSSGEYNSMYIEMIRFMREEDESSPEAVAIKNVLFANLVKFFQTYGHKKFFNDEQEFIEDLSYQTVMHILVAIKKGGTFELEKGNFLSYAIAAIHSTRVRLAQTYARAKKAFPMSQLDDEDQNFASTIPSKEPEEDLEAGILVSKVRSAIESVFKSLSEKETKKGWGDIMERFFLRGQGQGKICKELGVSRACFVACHRSMRKRIRMAIVQKSNKVERRKFAKAYFSEVINKLPDAKRKMILLYLALNAEKASKSEIAQLLNPPPSMSNKELIEGLKYIREEFIKCGLSAELAEAIAEKNEDSTDLFSYCIVPALSKHVPIDAGLSSVLKREIQTFKPREKFILYHYIGLDGIPKSTRSISVVCNISQMRVMQIAERGIQKIEGQLKNEEWLEAFRLHLHTANMCKSRYTKKKQWAVLKEGGSAKKKGGERIPEGLAIFMKDNLNDSQRSILRAILRNPDMTYAEIGKKLGITQSGVSKAVAKILPILRQCDCLEVAKTKGKIVIKIQGEIVSQSQKDRQEIETMLTDVRDPREKIKMIIERFTDTKTRELLLARLGYIHGPKTQKELASFYGMDQGNLCVMFKREFGKMRKYMRLAGIENEFDTLLSEVNRVHKEKKEGVAAGVLQEEPQLMIAVQKAV